ncbi:MAG: AMP-binding protein [Clostridiales bacterium]|nr:AMP-binding protein [Clostridiales bacterium]
MKSKKMYEVRKIINFKDMLKQSKELFAKKLAFVKKISDGNYKNISYEELYNNVASLGTSLLKLVPEKPVVCILGENRYEWCLAYLATTNSGGVVVPMDKELPTSEKINLIQQSNANIVIFSDKYSEEMKEIASNISTLKFFINMDLEDDNDTRLSLYKLVRKGEGLIERGDTSFEEVQVSSEEMSILLFTSGTMDNAKGVMLSQKNVCEDIMSVCTTVDVKKEDSSVSILPLHHTYQASLGFILLLYRGSTIYFNDGLRYIQKNLKEYGPTILITVPLLLENMHKKIWEQAKKTKGLTTFLKVAIGVTNVLRDVFKIDIKRKVFRKIHSTLGGNLRLIITGAAAIAPEVSKCFWDLGIKTLQGYGLTECAPLLIGNRDSVCRHGSIGLPIPGVDITINNPNEDGIGEILAKGPNIMLGYLINGEVDKSCFKDGWFYTGDLGYKDKDGFYYITGRNKNVIVTKNGKNIFPEELETKINSSPYVLESLVFGKSDEETGEVRVNAQIFPNIDAIKESLKAVVVSAEDIKKFLGDVIKNINKEIPLYKHIKEFTIRDTAFIKTTTQKIKRYKEIPKY